MEARVAVLEQIAKDLRESTAGIRSDMAAMRTDLSALRADVAKLDGRVSQLPTTWQMLTAMTAGQAVLAGAILGGLKLFGLH